jgi:hypothetical protein
MVLAVGVIIFLTSIFLIGNLGFGNLLLLSISGFFIFPLGVSIVASALIRRVWTSPSFWRWGWTHSLFTRHLNQFEKKEEER